MKYILCDKKVAQHPIFRSQFSTLNSQFSILIAGGEKCKTLTNVEKVWRFLLEHNATRNDTLVCVGGGSISDLGGFAASTYKRGMAWEIVPTTLLSMVDASVGGKTSINFDGYKNIVGVIQRPKKTTIDLAFLDTLPHEAFLSGMGEVIKTCLLSSEEDYFAALQALEDGHIGEELIMRCRSVKEQIVRRDPKEKNIRKSLNLGHTVGHALEEASLAYAQHVKSTTGKSSVHILPHGYAVMQGLVAELYLSVVHLGLEREPLRTLSHLMVEHYGRVGWTCKDYDVLLKLMREDKKNIHAGEITFTLLQHIGQPLINQTLPDDAIKEALEYLFTL